MDLDTTVQEEAVDALPDIDVVQETPTQQYAFESAAEFRRLLNTYKDELPDQTLCSYSPDSNYKCRAGWWCQLTSQTGRYSAPCLRQQLLAELHYKPFAKHQVLAFSCPRPSQWARDKRQSQFRSPLLCSMI